MAGNWNEDDLFGAGGGESVPDSVPDVVPVPVIPGPLPVEPGVADAHIQDLGSVEPDSVEPEPAGPDFVEPEPAGPDFAEHAFSGDGSPVDVSEGESVCDFPDEGVEPVVCQGAGVDGEGLVEEGIEKMSSKGGLDSSMGKVMPYGRYFTREGQDIFSTVTWEKRDAKIVAHDGAVVFCQTGMEFPDFYSLTASNVVASKYFRGTEGGPDRESSLKAMITRVVETIAGWALQGGYFADQDAVDVFADELAWLILHQYGSFNSPVWFNVGVEDHPQCSACFINSVEDTMESILGLAVTEGLLFKFGSGTGTNFSTIRSSRERLKGGGIPSGPVSFMRGYDAFAGVIKSGGKTRRAAKMVVLNADHPDIVDFIECKVREEDKALALIREGYDGSFGGEAYDSIFFQNANNSVRVTDEFMNAVVSNGSWQTKAITTGQVVETMKAGDLMDRMAKAAHRCGDPGIQFDTIVNDWHTCSVSGRINASNPCSEFMFLDNSACNLASLNLMRFVDDDGEFNTAAFRHAVRTFIIAQEVIVSNAKYPTEAIGRNSESYRPLGLGYANLGALLMNRGLAYDSDAGRAYAAAVTALMTGEAYVQSAILAGRVGPFAEYTRNSSSMLRVIRKHRAALETVSDRLVPDVLMEAARESWDNAVALGGEHGFRNAQVTLLAPTGTIGFMMDCDTTGIEPEMAIVKYKNLVGGGRMKIVNRTVPSALRKLGYTDSQIKAISDYVDRNNTIEGAPGLKDEHLSVFDCAFRATNGVRSIAVDGHIHMMGAVQPFLSGAISKTVNMPADATVEDVRKAYIDAWKYGLKAVAIYRDGSKGTQPVETSARKEPEKPAAPAAAVPVRSKLPDERQSLTHKFTISGLDGYITVGMHEDGRPGEIFITMAKQGSAIRGLMDSFATSVSIALQYGVPLEVLVSKFAHVRFEPNGFSSNPAIGYAKSIVDYVFRWLELKFISNTAWQRRTEVPLDLEAMAGDDAPPPEVEKQNDLFQGQEDAPPCSNCGWIMVRNGKCYKCVNCGSTSGCS
ncbi:MAG TPA: vitamin B12-dependent ribonucleotide reductase [Myxococcota bacterium]|nr:vitamin B12-dependent ribonucleotide reductase [Myxococcota bacterium]HOH76845.1 vitamin B12-dependent ribonucleotide reductase [Myxococcota bacterium]